MACKSSGGSSFSEALTYALRRLKMTQMTVKEEQRSSMRAVYEGSDVYLLAMARACATKRSLSSWSLATRRDL